MCMPNYQKRCVQTRKKARSYPGNISEIQSALQTLYLGDSCFSTLSLWYLFKEEYASVIVEKKSRHCKLFLTNVHTAGGRHWRRMARPLTSTSPSSTLGCRKFRPQERAGGDSAMCAYLVRTPLRSVVAS